VNTLPLRVLAGAEFAGALGVWGLGLCHWAICGMVATVGLTVFLFTFEDPELSPVAPRPRVNATPLRYCDCPNPLSAMGQCMHCGGEL
jgi:hypothetical protein